MGIILQQINIPYCYLIGWSDKNIWYYGCRYSKNCTPDDLWITYFTSSVHVKKYRLLHGEPDVVKVRRIFTDSERSIRIKKVLLWEETAIRRLDAVYNDKWLNKANAGHKFNNNGKLVVKDKITNELIGNVSVNDPRVLSGELVHHSTGAIPKRSNCLYCEATYPVSSIADHITHCKNNPNRERRLCCFCNKEFTDIRNHIRHQKFCKQNPNKQDPNMYDCQYCDKSYLDNGRKNEHELYCKGNPNKISKPTYTCVYCGKEFSLRILNKITHEKYCESNVNRIDTPNYICKHCSKVYNSSGTLAQHEIICKSNPNMVKQQCSHCNKEITGGTGNLSQHERGCVRKTKGKSNESI